MQKSKLAANQRSPRCPVESAKIGNTPVSSNLLLLMPVRPSFRWLLSIVVFTTTLPIASTLDAAGGSLTINCQEESDQSPTITRMELWRGNPSGKQIPVRRTVPAGIGLVLDRSAELTLPDGPYSFRMIRGPEYRVITGTFSLEASSLDNKDIELPRMIDMLDKGWTSGDCLVVASPDSLPLRMASEDLHLAAVLGDVPSKPIPRRSSDDPILHDPIWIRTDAHYDGGLVMYGKKTNVAATSLPIANAVAAKRNDAGIKVAIENPFAWPMPVWLASGRIDGVFVFGDWLRLDRPIKTVKDGRNPPGGSLGGGQAVGRWAEEIYRHVLDAGLNLPPLAGGGNDSAKTPVGYNRLYVADQSANEGYSSRQNENDSNSDLTPVASPDAWWSGAWNGQSVATNGPLLRPRIGGKIPGHVFKGSGGDELELQVELSLSVRDPVEYLEVIHNNQVHYSARLDEFAKAGGRIPPLTARQSGWVIVRVITLHEEHYRAAVSAPWYIEFDTQRRVGKQSVKFFQNWLVQYEERLRTKSPASLNQHAPYIRAARRFWQQKQTVAVD